jgi:two-component system LytT family response regulator
MVWASICFVRSFALSPHKMQILIADDEPRSALLLRKLMEPYLPNDTKVEMVHVYHEILPAIRHQALTLLFLDVQIQGLSAFDLLDQIPYRSFSTVITSASSQYAFAAFEYGVSGYLLKPVNPLGVYHRDSMPSRCN